MLGPNNSSLPRVFAIIAEGLVNEAIKSEDACSKRLANVIRQVQVCTSEQIGGGGGDFGGDDEQIGIN